MGSYKEYIEAKRNAWIGKKVMFEGQPYTVLDVDYNGGLLIDKADQFKKDTAVDESMVKVLDEVEQVQFCGSEDGHEVEYCSVCEREIELRWDINVDGFQAHCPVCGSRLMLCDACMHRFGECVDDCDYGMYEDKTICRFTRPDNWWKEVFQE